MIWRAETVNSLVAESHPVFELMSVHLTQAAVDLFAACNLHIEPSEAPDVSVSPMELHCMASIGYVACGARGALVLAASHAATKAWIVAAGITNAADCCASDAVGEFSNMLLGHLKARLLTEGM